MTTPPNAPEVDVLAMRRFAMEASPCGVSMEEVVPAARGFVYYLCSDIDPAVSAMLTRETALVAERDALRKMWQQAEDDIADRNRTIECKNIDIRERDESLRGWAARAKKAEGERDALAAEVGALREDAERYRWLRRIDSSPIHVFDLTSEETADASIYGEELDATIDAARAEASNASD